MEAAQLQVLHRCSAHTQAIIHLPQLTLSVFKHQKNLKWSHKRQLHWYGGLSCEEQLWKKVSVIVQSKLMFNTCSSQSVHIVSICRYELCLSNECADDCQYRMMRQTRLFDPLHMQASCSLSLEIPDWAWTDFRYLPRYGPSIFDLKRPCGQVLQLRSYLLRLASIHGKQEGLTGHNNTPLYAPNCTFPIQT